MWHPMGRRHLLLRPGVGQSLGGTRRVETSQDTSHKFNVCASLPHLAGTQKSSHSIRGSARVPARIHLTKQDGGRGDVCLTTAIAVPSIVVPTCGINDQSWSSYSGRSGLLITLVVCVRWCRSGAVSGKVRLTYIGWKLSGEETVGPGLYRGDWGWGAQSPGGV